VEVWPLRAASCNVRVRLSRESLSCVREWMMGGLAFDRDGMWVVFRSSLLECNTPLALGIQASFEVVRAFNWSIASG
jgi:hypothetical protein